MLELLITVQSLAGAKPVALATVQLHPDGDAFSLSILQQGGGPEVARHAC